jgi:hypothetical protein
MQKGFHEHELIEIQNVFQYYKSSPIQLFLVQSHEVKLIENHKP